MTAAASAVLAEIPAANEADAATMLHEAREQLRAITANVPGIVLQRVLSPDGRMRYSFLSSALERILGVTAAELEADYRAAERLIVRADLESAAEIVRRSAATLSRYSHDFRVAGCDGAIRWLHVTATPRRLHDGSILWDGVAIDVTEHKRTEMELRKSELHLSNAQKIAGLGSWEYDRAADRFIWSDGLYRILNVSPESFTPTRKSIMEIVHPAEREKYRENADAMLTGKVPPAIEGRLVRPDGQIRWVHQEGYPLLDRKGAVTGTFGVIQDITDRKMVQERLQRSSDHFRQAQRLAQIGSWEFDTATRELTWSEEIYRIFGMPPEFRPRPRSYLDLVADEDRERVGASLREVYALGKFDLEYRVRRPNGELRDVRTRTEVIRDDDGTIVRLIGAVQDVTAEKLVERRRRELETQLLQSQKMEALGTLAGGIAHDLNNTLVPIMMLSRLLLDDAPADAAERPSIELIHQAGGRARDLVRQILAFSRREASTRTALDLVAFVENALPMVRATCPTTIQIRTGIVAVPHVMADPSQVFHVLVNLVTNAVQAIGAKTGTITIALAASEFEGAPFASISVADTGHGMSPSTMQRMFEPFFTTKKAGEGTGLGLAAVHGIIADHGGRIGVTSAPGEGTTVTIHLPIAAEIAA